MPTQTCITTTLLLTNLLILSITLFWTINSWLHLHPGPPFLQRTCKVLDGKISHNHHYYRNEFSVTLYNRSTDPFPILPTIAFRYGSPIFNQTLREATKFHESFEEGRNYTCWIAPPEDVNPWLYTIALTYPDMTPTPNQRDMALVSTVFTAVAALAILFQVCCIRISNDVRTDFLAPTPPPPVRTPLDTEVIERVCKECEAAAIDCAICLEESDTPVAKLPCGHRFHMECVKRWLVRGGRNCPLCNWDLSQGYEENASESCAETPLRRRSGVVSDVVRNASWRRLTERSSPSCGDAEAGPSGEGLALLAAPGEVVGLRRRRSGSRTGNEGGESGST